MRKLATLLAATAAIATVTTTTTPAHAQTPPPNAWTCQATVTGVQVRRVDPSPLANPQAVYEITGTVVCEALGLLTHAPIDYLPLYSGGLALHVHSSAGGNDRCGGSVDPSDSVGPTLVMAATAVCVLPAASESVTYWPFAYWSTHDLHDNTSNVTIAGQAGAFLN